jgi:hypothetical protein
MGDQLSWAMAGLKKCSVQESKAVVPQYFSRSSIRDAGPLAKLNREGGISYRDSLVVLDDIEI